MEHDLLPHAESPRFAGDSPLRSRLAPSPTGAQHVGNARTYLVTWLDARTAGNPLVLRIEDLDTPRTKSWATSQILEDLAWLGLDWDDQAPMQSQRSHRYEEVLLRLRSEERVYPCTCTRSEIEHSAPHESHLDGVVYPGTCAHRSAVDAEALERAGQRFAWRFRMPQGIDHWHDGLFGDQQLDAGEALGDFVVSRNYGPPAYQLAVIVDDHDQSIGRVVRGADLIYSTFRQRAMLAALGWPTPDYLHVPLVVGSDGRRLAKRHGDTRLSSLRAQGVSAERLLGHLAHSLTLIDRDVPIALTDLLAIVRADPQWRSRIPWEPWVFEIHQLDG